MKPKNANKPFVFRSPSIDVKDGDFHLVYSPTEIKQVKSCPKPAMLIRQIRSNLPIYAVARMDAYTAHACLCGVSSRDNFEKYTDVKKDLIVKIEYPTEKPFVVKIMRSTSTSNYNKKSMTAPEITFGELVWAVAQAYVYVYAHAKEFGIWGHCLSDLAIESVKVYSNGVVDLGIGS